MPDVRQLQTNFTSGEVSPKIRGRIDHDRYKNGTSRMENFIVSPTGGAMKRNGTKSIGYIPQSEIASANIQLTTNAGQVSHPDVTDSHNVVEGVRMVPFIFNRSYSYVMVFIAVTGGCEVRIIDNSTKAFLKFNAQDVTDFAARGTTISSGNILKVYDGNFVLPYTKEQLAKLDFAQVEDTVFITHPSHPPRKITRADNAGGDPHYWSLVDVDFYDGPYEPLNVDSTKTISLSLAVDHTYLKFSIGTDIDDPPFGAGTLGRALATNDFVEYESEGDTVIGRVISVDASTDTCVVTAFDNVLKELDTNAVVESDEGDIKYIGGDNYTPQAGSGTTHTAHLLSLSSVFSKTHEGAYYKHRQYDKAGNAVTNRWVRIDEYLGLRTCKPHTASPATSPILRTWAPSKSGTAHSGSTHAFHDDIPTDGVIADCVSIDPGTWRPEHLTSNSSKFLFENTPAAGRVYQYDRVIYAKIKASSPIFNATTDAGRFIRLDFNGEKVWGRLSTASDATADGVGGAFSGWTNTTTEYAVRLYTPMPLDVQGNGEIMDKGITKNWQLGAWYSGNYPKAVTFFQQRMVYAGSPVNPQTIWFSKIGEYETFSPTDLQSAVLANSGFSYKIASSTVNEIIWLDSSENLLVGTSGSEWRVTSTSAGEAITPTNIKITQQTTFGSSDIPINRIGDSVVFVQAPGKIVRELSYSYDSDSFRAINLSVIADHLFDVNSPVIETSYLKYPHNQLFFKTGSGDLYSMTYEKEQKVVAYTKIFLGGHTRRVAPTSATGTIDDWASGVAYSPWQLVIKDSVIFECLDTHTSTTFHGDYSSSKWMPRGPSVMSMCSLPSSTDLTSDALYIASWRDEIKRDATTGACVNTDCDNYLCFEYLTPAGDSSVDTPTQKRVGSLVKPMDMSYSHPTPATQNSGNAINTITIPKTTLNPSGSEVFPIDLSASSHYIDISIVIYGGDEYLHVISAHPNGGGTCRLTESGSNYVITAYDSAGSVIPLAVPYTASRPYKWSIGFPFHSAIETLPMETAGDMGVSMGRMKRANEVTFNLENSGEFQFGIDQLDTVLSGDFTFNGQVTTTVDGGYSPYGGSHIFSNTPHLLNVLSMSPEVTINR